MITTMQKNQYSIENENEIIFQSYNTIICKIDKKNDTINITPGQPQSKTTAKYLNEFLKIHTGINNYKNI